MGFDNISAHNGYGIALTGMVIVFAALTMISTFIALLPKLLDALSFIFPPDPELQVAPQPTNRASGDEEVAAAIGYVLCRIENQRQRTG